MVETTTYTESNGLSIFPSLFKPQAKQGFIQEAGPSVEALRNTEGLFSGGNPMSCQSERARRREAWSPRRAVGGDPGLILGDSDARLRGRLMQTLPSFDVSGRW